MRNLRQLLILNAFCSFSISFFFFLYALLPGDQNIFGPLLLILVTNLVCFNVGIHRKVRRARDMDTFEGA